MRTELIADQPTVLLLHHNEGVVSTLEKEIQGKSVQLRRLSLDAAVDQAFSEEDFTDVYKICWLISPEWFVNTSVLEQQKTLTFLESFQQKITLVMPVISQYVEDFPGEIPFLSTYLDNQKSTIAVLNRYLSGSQWIFLQDAVAPIAQFQTTLPSFLSQDIQAGKLYAPKTTWYPFALQQGLARVVGYFLQPSRGSYVIRGQALDGKVLAQLIKERYQSIYFEPISLQTTNGLSASPIPFSATENIVAEAVEPALNEFVDSFSSPNRPLFQFSWQAALRQNSPPPANQVNNQVDQISSDGRVQDVDNGLEQDANKSSTQEIAQSVQNVTQSANQVGQQEATQVLATAQIPSTAHEPQPLQKAQFPQDQTQAQSPPQQPQVAREVRPSQRSQSGLEAQSAREAQSPQQSQPAQETQVELEPQVAPEQKTIEKPAAKKAENAFNLNQEVVRLFSTSHLTTKHTRTESATKERNKIIKKTKKRTALFYGGLTFTGMGLGILFLIIVFMTSVTLFGREVRQNAELVVSAAQQKTTEQPRFGPLKNIVSLQADAYGVVLSLPAIEDAQSLVLLADAIEQSHQVFERSRSMTQNLVGSILISKDTQVASVAPNLAIDSVTAHENTQRLTDLFSMSGLWSEDDGGDGELTQLLEKVNEVAEERRSSMIVLQQLSGVLPDLLAANEQRTYALVFQNNQEIRPTGGFIEAVALITLSQDGLVGYEVLNNYQVDRGLPGTVEAPEAIRRFFGEEQLLFHDSNWDPHFPKTAEQITWFLEKSQNRDVDGVMTIDVAGLARFLEYLGPLDVPEYSEVVTHRTLAERIEFNSEVILLDESDKKDYRQLVFEKLLQKIQQTPVDKTHLILQAMRVNFEEQSMLFVPKRASEREAFLGLGWTGGILNPQCPTQLSKSHCQIEVVAQFEANVGVNKANFYLERAIEHVVSMQQQSVLHERSINYTNTAQTNSWPKGPYRSYVRLYLPKNAVIDTLQVGEQTLTSADLDSSQEHDRQVVGFYIEVPVDSTLPVVLRFTTPRQSHDGDRFAYALFEQQQPGIENESYRFRITPPPAYSPILIAPQPDIRG
ncbi:MAG: DUF4012 domain-containing protein, partial [Patescibacteria group bacterium]